MPSETEDAARRDEVAETLQRVFGYDAYRAGQREIIDAVLEGRDAFALLPTGGGKSLTYQLPALLLPGITVVVSPLIALMQDQVERLDAQGIPATFLNSALEPGERSRARGRRPRRALSPAVRRAGATAHAAISHLPRPRARPARASPLRRR